MQLVVTPVQASADFSVQQKTDAGVQAGQEYVGKLKRTILKAALINVGFEVFSAVADKIEV
jgi:hypothetical protein